MEDRDELLENEAPIEESEAQAEKQDETPSLAEVIKEQAKEEDSFSSNFTLRKILGGDILSTNAMKRQVGLLLLITAFVIVYITNRYRCQNYQIEIDNLKKELQDAKYKALSSSSQLTEKSRESNVLDMLKNNNDSLLHISQQPPYYIKVPEE